MKHATQNRLRIITIIFSIILISASSTMIAADIPLIFPIPQQLKINNQSFILDKNVEVLVPKNAGQKDMALAKLLVKELSNKYGLPVMIESSSVIPKDRKVIIIGTLSNLLIKKYCDDNKIILTKQSPGKEGYILNATNNLIAIAGWDDAGAFYGLQSLRQLMRAGNGIAVQGVQVKDWPNQPFRAIRLFVPGPDNMAFFKRFMSDFMALYKYNKVVIEFNCMRLDRHPEVNTGWLKFVNYMQYSRSNTNTGIYGEEKNSSHYDSGEGFIIEKETVRDLVETANDNFLEVIPEIQSLTHSYALLTEHPELAEYRGDNWPDTYCPSNPDSYKLMFDVYDEYMEVIKPKMVHIGHDEWWGAPNGSCPLCKGKDYSKLFAGDVIKIHDYFTKKGIKTAMWGDYLLESVRQKGTQKRVSSTGVNYETPGAVRPEIVKEMIPKDILIFNWFWVNQEREQEIDKFGFTQIYGNFTPNISDWDSRIEKIKLAGGAPSSWAVTNEVNFGKDIMLDFLGCANLMWSSHNIKQIDMPEIVWHLIPSIRASLSGKKIPSEDDNTVESIDISNNFNLPKNSTFFGIDINKLKTGDIRVGKKIFKIMDTNKFAVGVGSEGIGKNTLPNKVEGIVINEDVSSLIFLHACALPAGNQKAYFNVPNNFDTSDMLGWYEVVYEDGFKEIIPIQYGVNILEYNPGGEKSLDKREGDTGEPQRTYCYGADAVHCGTDLTNHTPTFFALEWVNKRFGKVIKEVNLHGTIKYQATQQNYLIPETKPAESNAIFLAGISKVKKREARVPLKK
jgi:Glycosyl hydrolase family 20, domain 2/Glycosyl hydrolase family 20, catalytic domain